MTVNDSDPTQWGAIPVDDSPASWGAIPAEESPESWGAVSAEAPKGPVMSVSKLKIPFSRDYEMRFAKLKEGEEMNGGSTYGRIKKVGPDEFEVIGSVGSDPLAAAARAGIVDLPGATAGMTAFGGIQSQPFVQSLQRSPFLPARIAGVALPVGGAILAGAGGAMTSRAAVEKAMPDLGKQLQVDQEANPNAVMAGSVLSELPFARVGSGIRLAERALGAGIAGGVQTGTEAMAEGDMDKDSLLRIAMAAAGGSAFTDPTKLGAGAMNVGARMSSKKPITSQLGNASTKSTIGEANAAANAIAVGSGEAPKSAAESAEILSKLVPTKSAIDSANVFIGAEDPQAKVQFRTDVTSKQATDPDAIESALLGINKPKGEGFVGPDMPVIEVPKARDTVLSDLLERDLLPPEPKAEKTLLADIIKDDGGLEGFQPVEPKAPMDFEGEPLVNAEKQAADLKKFNKRVADVTTNLKNEGVDLDRQTAVKLARLAGKPDEFNAARQQLIESTRAANVVVPKKGPLKALEELPPKVGQDDVADPEFADAPEPEFLTPDPEATAPKDDSLKDAIARRNLEKDGRLVKGAKGEDATPENVARQVNEAESRIAARQKRIAKLEAEKAKNPNATVSEMRRHFEADSRYGSWDEAIRSEKLALKDSQQYLADVKAAGEVYSAKNPSAPKVAAKPKSDYDRYTEIQARWAKLIKEDPASPEINKLWAENEEIKNRHDGMPPRAPEAKAEMPNVETPVAPKQEAPKPEEVVTTKDEPELTPDEARFKKDKEYLDKVKTQTLETVDSFRGHARFEEMKKAAQAARKASQTHNFLKEHPLDYGAAQRGAAGREATRAFAKAKKLSEEMGMTNKQFWDFYGGDTWGAFDAPSTPKAPEAPEEPARVSIDDEDAIDAQVSKQAESAKEPEVTVTKSKGNDFSTKGTYDVSVNGKRIGGIFRDPEDKWWYRDAERGENSHHTQRVMGFNKKEAIQGIMAWAKKQGKLGIVPPEDPLVSATRKGMDKVNDALLNKMAKTEVENSRPQEEPSFFGTKKEQPKEEVNETELDPIAQIYENARRAVEKTGTKAKPRKSIEDQIWKESREIARDNGMEEPDESIAKDIADAEEVSPAYRPLLTDIAGRWPIVEKIPGIRTGAHFISGGAQIIKKALGTVHGNIRDVSPRMSGSLRQKEFELSALRVHAKQADKLGELLRKHLTKSEFAEINSAFLTGDREAAMKIIKRNPNSKEITEALEVNLEIKRQMLAEERRYGREVGETDFYFHRRVSDRKGLAKALGRNFMNEYDDAIRAATKQKKRALTVPEQDDIMNSLIQGTIRKGGPSFAKARSIEKITQDLAKFYDPFDVSDYGYLTSVTRDMNSRKWFGKAGDEYDPFEGNLGKVLNEEYKAGRIGEEGLEIVKDNLGAYAKSARSIDADMVKWASRLRRIQTYAYLADIGNAIIQYAEFFTNARTFGVTNAAKGFGKKSFSLDDIKVFEGNPDLLRFKAESPDASNTRKVVKGMEKLYQKSMQSFLGAADKFMTGTTAQAAYKWVSGVVKKPNSIEFRQLNEKYSEMFPERWPRMLEALKSDDFKNGKLNEDTSFFIWNEVANLKPISGTDRARGYHGSNDFVKLLYTLRTYPIKQLDIMRNIGYEEMKRGNFAVGAAQMGLFALFVGAGQQSLNYVRDKMFNREAPLTEYAVTGFLQTMFMIPRYAFYRAKQSSPTDAFVDTLIPGIGLTRDVTKDMGMAGRYFLDHRDSRGAETVDDLADAFSQSRMVQYAPGVGRAVFWWAGAGAEGEQRQRDAKLAGKEQKGTLETISELFLQPDSKSPRKN